MEILTEREIIEEEINSVTNDDVQFYAERTFWENLVTVIFTSLIIIPTLFVITLIYLILLIPNKGKVIFKQKRIGLNGKEFNIYKFRTLHSPIEISLEKNQMIIKNNSHPIGLFLRKTGLDEVLQIVNIVKGDMNLIGPRPLLKRDLVHLSSSQFHKRHIVKPGILGLWQIRRKYSDDRNYFRYDDFYLKKQSLAFDLYIFFSTVSYMLKRKGR